MSDILWAAVIVSAAVLLAASALAGALRKLPSPADLSGLEQKLDELAASQRDIGFWANELIDGAYDIAGKERPKSSAEEMLENLLERLRGSGADKPDNGI